MKEYIPILKQTKLFADVGEEDILAMLGCLQAVKRSYRKGEFVHRQGEQLRRIAVLAEGTLHIRRDDYWGNRSIVNVIAAGEMFGESYAAPDSEPLLYDIVAVEECTVISFEIRKLLTVCSAACRFHSLVIQNLLYTVTAKNRQLTQKLNHMAQRTTREKLLSYLSEQSKKSGSATFAIPFNRQELADFLSVDRSAMSGELGRMRDEGLIRFEKNRFTLL